MHVDKHQSSLQVDLNTSGINVFYKVILIGMIKHSQNTQSNKFAISLQYFEKEVRDGVTVVFYCNAKHSDILRGHRRI